jgi:hypothetical protein
VYRIRKKTQTKSIQRHMAQQVAAVSKKAQHVRSQEMYLSALSERIFADDFAS